MELITYETIRAVVKKRPSEKIKSPYVADIIIEDKTYLAHTPGLHLGGQIVEGSIVYVQKSNEKSKTDYKIICVFVDGTFVCAQPLYANYIFEKAVEAKQIEEFQNYKKLKREVTVEKGHRVDFKIDNSYIEVKSVVCKEENTAIFPVGGVLKKIEDTEYKTISPRAIKHILNLDKMENTYLYFVILRNDCTEFTPNYKKDPYFSYVLNNTKNITIRCFYVNVSKHNITFGDMIEYKKNVINNE